MQIFGVWYVNPPQLLVFVMLTPPPSPTFLTRKHLCACLLQVSANAFAIKVFVPKTYHLIVFLTIVIVTSNIPHHWYEHIHNPSSLCFGLVSNISKFHFAQSHVKKTQYVDPWVHFKVCSRFGTAVTMSTVNTRELNSIMGTAFIA